jgi:hypothetical protein
MIIDDERDDDYDENYYIVTFVVVPPFTYETPANLTIILQMDVYLISELMFLTFKPIWLSMCEINSTRLMYFLFNYYIIFKSIM